jgi:predicted CopG family antitoxin
MKTLRISDETHRELMMIGSYEETMDDIIKKLLRHWKSQQ